MAGRGSRCVSLTPCDGGALVAGAPVMWLGGRIPARRIIVVVAAKELGSEAVGRAGLASSHVARGLAWGCSVR
jgi:hypothetical protein